MQMPARRLCGRPEKHKLLKTYVKVFIFSSTTTVLGCRHIIIILNISLLNYLFFLECQSHRS